MKDLEKNPRMLALKILELFPCRKPLQNSASSN